MQVALKVNMTCEGCVGSVKKILAKTEGMRKPIQCPVFIICGSTRPVIPHHVSGIVCLMVVMRHDASQRLPVQFDARLVSSREDMHPATCAFPPGPMKITLGSISCV